MGGVPGGIEIHERAKTVWIFYISTHVAGESLDGSIFVCEKKAEMIKPTRRVDVSPQRGGTRDRLSGIRRARAGVGTDSTEKVNGPVSIPFEAPAISRGHTGCRYVLEPCTSPSGFGGVGDVEKKVLPPLRMHESGSEY